MGGVDVHERYTLFREIGSGSMGTVSFGRQRGPHGFARTVAIKRMHPSMASDPERVAMFVDEARIAARIAHPNVLATLDVEVDVAHGEVLLVMEYVHGESLLHLLRAPGARPRPEIIASIVVGVLHGLHAAHEATSPRGELLELVHRDVSPGNVLVGTDGVARIMDFGVAKAIGRLHLTRDGNVKGKLGYMSPEQLYGESIDRRADIWAVGVVLWEALAGRPLFRRASDAETIDQLLHADIPPPSELASELEPFDAIVRRAISRDADARYETAREMAIALEQAVSCAAPSEIGEWVSATAREALARRTNELDMIEAASLRRDPEASASARRWRWGRPIAVITLMLATVVLLFGRLAPRQRESAREPPAPPGDRVPDPSPLVDPPRSLADPPVVGDPPVAAVPMPSPPPPKSTRGARRQKASVQAPAEECTMPYWMDAEGRKHYKPECL